MGKILEKNYELLYSMVPQSQQIAIFKSGGFLIPALYNRTGHLPPQMYLQIFRTPPPYISTFFGLSKAIIYC